MALYLPHSPQDNRTWHKCFQCTYKVQPLQPVQGSFHTVYENKPVLAEGYDQVISSDSM